MSGCGFVVITAGARGAGMLRDGRWLWEPGRPVKVADSVGAGDAFAASLVAHLLHGQSPDREILSRACRLGGGSRHNAGHRHTLHFSITN